VVERVDISERLGVTDAVRVSLSCQDGPPCFPLTRELCVEPQPQTSSGMLFSVTYSKNGAHRWLQLQYLPTACHVDLPWQPLHNGTSVVFAGRYLPHLQCHAQSSKADH